MQRRLQPARRAAAIAAAFASLGPLLALQLVVVQHGGTSGDIIVDHVVVDYRAGELTAAQDVAATVLAVAIAAAAAGLWAARSRVVLTLALAAGVLGGVGTAVAVGYSSSREITEAEHRAVPLGVTHEALEDRLGGAAGYGSGVGRAGRFVDCSVYWRATDGNYLYCFEGDRLVKKDFR